MVVPPDPVRRRPLRLRRAPESRHPETSGRMDGNRNLLHSGLLNWSNRSNQLNRLRLVWQRVTSYDHRLHREHITCPGAIAQKLP